MSPESADTDSPRVIAFPPLLYAGTLALGLIAHAVRPVQPLPPVPARVLGGLVVVASLVLSGAARAAMRRAGTNIRPDQPTLAIVTDGPFRFTRNPLYVALIGIYAGTTLLFDALWPWVLLVPLLVVTQWGIVRREERYLESKFGDTYRSYRARVRRWF